MRKWLSWVLILAGAGVLLYPTLQNQYYNYKQQQLVASWEESLLAVDSIDTDTEITLDFSVDDEQVSALSDLEDLTVSTDEPEGDSATATDTSDSEAARIAAEEAAAAKAAYIEENMEGILIIDRIDFKQPILRGASRENMLLTVTSFDSDAYPGQIGNYAIIGHRNLTYGRNFNRLGEVEIGDELIVVTDDGRFVYRVREIFLVLPDDVGVLFGTQLEKRITLITCDPIGNPTHRLIIRGTLVE